MVLKSCLKPADCLSNIFLYPSWHFIFVNITLFSFIEFGVLLWVKSLSIVLSALNDIFRSLF